jgi:uncharacterized membrane protein
MAFCPNCGNQVAGRFCPNCGTDVGVAASTGAGAGPAGAGPTWSSSTTATPPPPGMAAAPGLSQNMASTLCYVLGLITGIIFLVLSPYNTNRAIRFHAWQSIFLSIAAIILNIGIPLTLTIMHMWILLIPVMGLIHLGFFILWLYLLFTTFNGRTVKLPVIGDLAEKQA